MNEYLTTCKKVLTLLCVISPAAHAGGLYVPGAGGASAMGRAGAFVAKADDPTALFHNPAGFAKGVGTVIMIAANLVNHDLTVHRAGNYETPILQNNGTPQPYPSISDKSSPKLGLLGYQAIPFLAVTTDFGLKLPGIRFALGLFAPNGFAERRLDADYEFEDPHRNPPPTRYDTIAQDVLVVFPSAGASWSYQGAAVEVDLGARLSWGLGSINSETYVWALRNYEENIGIDSLVKLNGKDSFVPAFGLGALIRPTKNLEFGLAYNSQATLSTRGTTAATPGEDTDKLGIGLEIVPQRDASRLLCGDQTDGSLGKLTTCIDVVTPHSASLGGRYVFFDKKSNEIGDIELDIKWENWSAASDIRVRIDGTADPIGIPLKESFVRHGFRDTLSVRLGGSYAFLLGAHGKLIVSSGGAYDTAAAPNAWQRADIDGAAKTTLTGGIAYELAPVRVALAGGVVLQPDRTVADCQPTVSNPNPTCTADGDVPSPVQPLLEANQQVTSPFNAGSYSSSYSMLSLGVTTWF